MISRDIAVDLGTANVLVRSARRGLIVREPALVAIDERSGEVLSFGEAARGVLGESDRQAVALWPLRRGTVTDYYVIGRMFKAIMKRAGTSRVFGPRVLVCVPMQLSPVERRAIEDAAHGAGARKVLIIPSALAAALGAGLPIEEPRGTCVVDVGGGITECVVLSFGAIVASRTLRIGGFDMDEAVQRSLRDEHGMAIGERAAEELKIQIGSAMSVDVDVKAEVRGRDLASGAPKMVIVAAGDVRAALDGPVTAVIEALRQTLAETPPELAHDVLERGILFTGGASLLSGFAQRITHETGIPVRQPEDPVGVVALGAERALRSLSALVRAGLIEPL